MRSICRLVCACLLFVAISGGGPRPAAAEQPWPSVLVGVSEDTAKILAALDQPTRLEFIQTSVEDVATYIADQHEVTVLFDAKALAEAGIDIAVPLTGNIKNMSLRSGLRHLLGDAGLGFVVRDEALVITTQAIAAAAKEIRVYDVQPLLIEGEGAAELVVVLTATLRGLAVANADGSMGGGFFAVVDQIGGDTPGAAPMTSAPAASPGSIVVFRNSLIVNDTMDRHLAIAGILSALAKTTAKDAPAVAAPAPALPPPPAPVPAPVPRKTSPPTSAN